MCIKQFSSANTISNFHGFTQFCCKSKHVRKIIHKICSRKNFSLFPCQTTFTIHQTLLQSFDHSFGSSKNCGTLFKESQFPAFVTQCLGWVSQRPRVYKGKQGIPEKGKLVSWFCSRFLLPKKILTSAKIDLAAKLDLATSSPELKF